MILFKSIVSNCQNENIYRLMSPTLEEDIFPSYFIIEKTQISGKWMIILQKTKIVKRWFITTLINDIFL